MKKLTITILLNLLTFVSYSQNKDFSFNEVTHELIITNNNENNLDLVYWLPPEYWQLLLEQNIKHRLKNIDSLYNIFTNRIVFAALKGEQTNEGKITFKAQKEINQNIIYTDKTGNRFFPIEPNKIDYRLQSLFEKLKPAFANIIGQKAQNIQFIVFDTENESTPPSPKDKGRFYLKFFNSDYSFPLPVEIFLQKK